MEKTIGRFFPFLFFLCFTLFAGSEAWRTLNSLNHLELEQKEVRISSIKFYPERTVFYSWDVSTTYTTDYQTNELLTPKVLHEIQKRDSLEIGFYVFKNKGKRRTENRIVSLKKHGLELIGVDDFRRKRMDFLWEEELLAVLVFGSISLLFLLIGIFLPKWASDTQAKTRKDILEELGAIEEAENSYSFVHQERKILLSHAYHLGYAGRRNVHGLIMWVEIPDRDKKKLHHKNLVLFEKEEGKFVKTTFNLALGFSKKRILRKIEKVIRRLEMK